MLKTRNSTKRTDEVLADALPPIAEKILAAPLENEPYPYVIADDLFEADLLAEIKDFWPNYETFGSEGPGQGILLLAPTAHVPGVLQTMKPAASRFWGYFTRQIFPLICLGCFARFAGQFQSIYGAHLESADIDGLRIGEMDDTAWLGNEDNSQHAEGLNIHAHYYHDPFWLFTLLIYIDDGVGIERGTSIHKFVEDRPLNDCMEIIPKSSGTHDLSAYLEHEKTVEFVPNRLFSFLDGPFSMHRVEWPKGDGSRRRRLLRAHVQAPAELAEQVFGFSLAEFRTRIQQGSIGWVEENVRAYTRAAAELSDTEARDFARNIKFRGYGYNL